jgi:hypothetical protein
LHVRSSVPGLANPQAIFRPLQNKQAKIGLFSGAMLCFVALAELENFNTLCVVIARP